MCNDYRLLRKNTKKGTLIVGNFNKDVGYGPTMNIDIIDKKGVL